MKKEKLSVFGIGPLYVGIIINKIQLKVFTTPHTQKLCQKFK